MVLALRPFRWLLRVPVDAIHEGGKAPSGYGCHACAASLRMMRASEHLCVCDMSAKRGSSGATLLAPPMLEQGGIPSSGTSGPPDSRHVVDSVTTRSG